MKPKLFITWDGGIAMSIDNGAGITIGESRLYPHLGLQAFEVTTENFPGIKASILDRPNLMFPFGLWFGWQHEDGSYSEMVLGSNAGEVFNEPGVGETLSSLVGEISDLKSRNEALDGVIGAIDAMMARHGIIHASRMIGIETRLKAQADEIDRLTVALAAARNTTMPGPKPDPKGKSAKAPKAKKLSKSDLENEYDIIGIIDSAGPSTAESVASMLAIGISDVNRVVSGSDTLTLKSGKITSQK